MAISIDSLDKRCRELSETMRLAILVSIFWPVFSFIYILEPHTLFVLSDFLTKFILMGFLPLVVGWGSWWVVRGFRPKKYKKC